LLKTLLALLSEIMPWLFLVIVTLIFACWNVVLLRRIVRLLVMSLTMLPTCVLLLSKIS